MARRGQRSRPGDQPPLAERHGVDARGRVARRAGMPRALRHPVAVGGVVMAQHMRKYALMVPARPQEADAPRLTPIERLTAATTASCVLSCRVLNFAVALAGLIIAAPLMAAIALLIKATSRGSVLYRQERIGWNRRAPRARSATFS